MRVAPLGSLYLTPLGGNALPIPGYPRDLLRVPPYCVRDTQQIAVHPLLTVQVLALPVVSTMAVVRR